MNGDEQNLWYLGVANYVYAGIIALVGCFPLIHFGFGIALLSGVIPPSKASGGPPEQLLGGVLATVAGIIILVAWTHAALVVLAGRCLQQRCWYTFCFIMACIQCAWAPIGTAIGVLTIVLLIKPENKALFSVGPPAKQASF